MAISIFDEKALIPTDDMVAAALSESRSIWNDLYNHLRENYPSITAEWKHYGKASGWVLKLLSKKRNLFFFIPKSGCFRLRLGLSEKAAACALAADLPEGIKEAIRTATRYVEGQSIDLEISIHEVKVMAYAKDRELVDIGQIDGQQLEIAKTLVQLRYDN